MTMISQLASPNVMASLNAGDVDTAMSQLRDSGISVDSGENIAKAFAGHYATQIQNIRLSIDYVRALNIPEEERQRRLASLENDIRSAEDREKTLQQRMANISTETCPVCFDSLDGPTCLMKCCQNIFCLDCIRTISTGPRSSRCPMCRGGINADTVQVIHKGNLHSPCSSQHQPKRLSKVDTLRKIIKDNPDGRFLVFSSYQNTFSHIMEAFRDEEGFRMERPIGSGTTIAKRVKEFKDGKINVMLLNSQNLGAGLNLQCATHVIFFHKMTQTMQVQVIGRAQRSGRTSTLRVMHLLHDNE